MNARLRFWMRLAQALVAAGLCYWLVRQVDWPNMRGVVAGLRWEPLALSVGILLAAHLLNVSRWRYLLAPRAPGFGQLLRWYAIGVFCNNFLPTGIGGDGVRAALLSRAVAPGRALFSVALDRGTGLVALSALFGLGMVLGTPPGLDLSGGRWLAALRSPGGIAIMLVVVAVLVAVLIVAVRRPALRARVAARLAAWDIPQWGAAEWARRMAVAYSISVGAHLCIAAATWATLVALGVSVPLGAPVWLMVLSSLSLLLPVTVNGVGVVESVYVLVLGSYGVAPALGLSVALITRAVALLISLCGGALLLGRRAIIAEVAR